MCLFGMIYMDLQGNLFQMEESGESTLFQGDSPVNHTALQANERAKMTFVISGRRCLESLKRLRRDGALLKTLLEFSAMAQPTMCVPSWKILATPAGRLILRLALLDYQRWNGTSGLLPRATASDHKGASAQRFRTSPQSHGNFREVIRESATDGQYPRPEFVEWMKGYPIGWTEIER